MQKIESSFKSKDMHEFFNLVKRATTIKKSGAPIKGLKNGDEVVMDKEEVTEQVIGFYQQLYALRNAQEAEVHREQSSIVPVTYELFEEALCNCDFKKGVGPDGFDGRLLLDQDVRQAVYSMIELWFRSGTLPVYLHSGRLVLLSKDG